MVTMTLPADAWDGIGEAGRFGTLTLAATDARMAEAIGFRGRVHVDADSHRRGTRRFIKARRRPDGTWFVVRHMGHWVQDIVGIRVLVIHNRPSTVRTVVLGPTRIRSQKGNPDA